MTQERIYAGDIVYDSEFFTEDKSRTEIIEFLDDLCCRLFPGYYKNDSFRLSAGSAIDTILLLLDVAVKPEDIERFKDCLKDQIEESTEYEENSEDVNPQSEAAD